MRRFGDVCLECEATLGLAVKAPDVEEGEIALFPDCGVELEVPGLDPEREVGRMGK